MSYSGQPKRKPRRRILLGCAGESEQSYGALLQIIANEKYYPLHIKTEVFNGGDPLSLVQQIRQYIDQDRAKGEPAYSVHGLLLDDDFFGRSKRRDAQALQIATAISLHLIRQRTLPRSFPTTASS